MKLRAFQATTRYVSVKDYESIVLTNTLSLVFVSQRTSSCWIRSDSVPATLDIGQQMKWHPGSLKDLNWPKSSTMPTFCWRIHATQKQLVDILLLYYIIYCIKFFITTLWSWKVQQEIGFFWNWRKVVRYGSDTFKMKAPLIDFVSTRCLSFFFWNSLAFSFYIL